MQEAKSAEKRLSSLSAVLLNLFFGFYKLFVSPAIHLLAGAQSGCRFDPTCSEYSRNAFQQHGFTRGLLMSVRRVSRCHPWSRIEQDL